MFNFFTKKSQPQQLFFNTDIHCHILPGIDDGAKDVDTSVELIEKMQSWGIKRIIASPHVTYETFENTQKTADDAMNLLQAELTKRGNNLVLTHSAENRIDDLFLSNLEKGTLMTLPGNRLLIENSFMQEPWELDQLLFELQLKGYNLIMVHPERYSYYYARKERYEAIHRGGTAFQVNLLSLAGYYGRDEKKYAEYLISKGWVEYVGTDLHNFKHVEAIENYLCSKDYKKHKAALEGCIFNDRI